MVRKCSFPVGPTGAPSSPFVGCHQACAVGRTRISFSDIRFGRETGNAMTSAMTSGLIAIPPTHSCTALRVSSWVMCSGSSVATAPGSITITRTSGCSSSRKPSDQPPMPHLAAHEVNAGLARRRTDGRVEAGALHGFDLFRSPALRDNRRRNRGIRRLGKTVSAGDLGLALSRRLVPGRAKPRVVRQRRRSSGV
jgi:hypothetical protein